MPERNNKLKRPQRALRQRHCFFAARAALQQVSRDCEGTKRRHECSTSVGRRCGAEPEIGGTNNKIRGATPAEMDKKKCCCPERSRIIAGAH